MNIKKEMFSHEKQKAITTKQSDSSSKCKNENCSKEYIKFLNGNLYQLLTSEYFTINHLMDYLIHNEEIFVIDCIINLLSGKFKKNAYYYLPQLCSLILSKKYNKPIESFIINHSAEDLIFAISAYWIFDSFINDERLIPKQKQCIKFIELLEGAIISGNKKEINKNYFIEKEKKISQFDNSQNFYKNLNKLCLKLKELKPDNSLIIKSKNKITTEEKLKATRRKYLYDKIKSFNDDIINTFKDNKFYDPYIGIILPFEQKIKKIIVHILPQYSFFYVTKERISVKLTMECVNAEELNEKKIIDQNLIQSISTINEDELDSENNVIGMESDEKKKELSKDIIAQITKLLEKIKYENEHPNEQIRKEPQQEKFGHPTSKKQNEKKIIFNPFVKPWKKTERMIKEKSHFKIFKSLSVVSFIVKVNNDLRQEAMAMQLIQKYDEIFKSENLPLKLHPYEIIITSNSSGLIEFIPDTISFDALKKKLLENNISFAEYFKNYYGDDFQENLKNFVESLAGYSLLCYLLAIKNRHNGHILLDKDGCIIHISFGFILGISPGGNLNFENAPFKLTRDYIDLMGGIDSDIFPYFKSLFIKGLFAARKNVDVIVNLIEAMGCVPMPCFNGRNIRDIINAFKERCFTKYTEVEIIPLASNLIDSSVNSWRTTQYDYYQKLENNIQP